MIERIKVQDWTGKIIGFIELDTSTGNKQIKDFSGKIKGKYMQSSILPPIFTAGK